MNCACWFRKLVVSTACVGVLAPHFASAATTVDAPPTVADVALQAGGTLTGQIVNEEGQARAGVKVAVSQQQTQIAEATTDDNGNFTVTGLRGGVHQVVTDAGVATYRFWAPNTAPPAAPARVMVIADQELVRGQATPGRGRFVRFITNPWVLAGLVATAIAVPIALNNDDDKSGS